MKQRTNQFALPETPESKDLGAAGHLLIQLVRDVKACGGRDVILGIPTEAQYEFVAQGERFSGFLHPTVIWSFFAALKERDSLVVKAKSDPHNAIRVGVTKHAGRAALYVSWED